MNLYEPHRAEFHFSAIYHEDSFVVRPFNGDGWNATLPRVMPGTVVPVKFWHKVKAWIFPKERFTTYEPKDERWCRFFGIGHEGWVTREVSCDAMLDTSINPSSRDLIVADITVTPVGAVTMSDREE